MCFIVILLYLQFVSRQTGIIKLQIRLNSRSNSQRQLEEVTKLKNHFASVWNFSCNQAAVISPLK